MNHKKIKNQIQTLIQKYEGKDNLKKKASEFISKIFEPKEEDQDKILEGFEPHTVALDISMLHVDNILNACLQNYDENSNKFSNSLCNILQRFSHELITEVSEGFNDGIVGVEEFLRLKLRNYISKVSGPENSVILIDVLWANLWKKITNKKENVPAISETEEKLLKEISETLETDQSNPPRTLFSEAYLRGDLSFQEK